MDEPRYFPSSGDAEGTWSPYTYQTRPALAERTRSVGGVLLHIGLLASIAVVAIAVDRYRTHRAYETGFRSGYLSATLDASHTPAPGKLLPQSPGPRWTEELPVLVEQLWNRRHSPTPYLPR